MQPDMATRKAETCSCYSCCIVYQLSQ